MFNINSFLERFKKITPPEYDVRKNISDIVKNKINIEVPINHIVFRNNIIYIKTKPIYKNEIFLKKELILNDFKNKLPNIYIKNIL